MTRLKRQRAVRRGRWGERLAAMILRLKGYRILATGYQPGLGEIDIVARKGRILVFVEVKTRRDPGDAISAVSSVQLERIARSAETFVASRPVLQGLDWRFDVIGIAPFKWPCHIVDAWQR